MDRPDTLGKLQNGQEKIGTEPVAYEGHYDIVATWENKSNDADATKEAA